MAGSLNQSSVNMEKGECISDSIWRIKRCILVLICAVNSLISSLKDFLSQIKKMLEHCEIFFGLFAKSQAGPRSL